MELEGIDYSGRRRYACFLGVWSSDVCLPILRSTPTGGCMSNRKGFTLIELLIVVVIIGILEIGRASCRKESRAGGAAAWTKEKLRNEGTVDQVRFPDNEEGEHTEP